MIETAWLIDKSALARLGASPDADLWSRRIERGLVQVATPTILEIGHSAQGVTDWTNRVEMPPVALMPLASITPAAERRAVEVQRRLAHAGHHRTPSVPDILIAAIAELDRLAVLHVDKAFEVIADVTGQETHRLQTSD
ncbi:PIN domain-containing protein [Saccharomonospora iraqiensis]|uniref:ribonuclease n=1 Tax=Saccharomonospora iraqiensis TaxID=52698 RepID=UPI0004913261|nr:ribonuclease [Saccharomonospora iraqiensis]